MMAEAPDMRLNFGLVLLSGSFVKFKSHEDCFYGHLYEQRKAYELERDAAVREVPTHDWYEVPPGRTVAESVEIAGKHFVGGNAAAAAATLEQRKIREATTRATYESGHLPAGRLDLRARRWAVKLFLAHMWEEGYRQRTGKEPPAPYPIAVLGHAHRIEAPA
jgi:hypothetical protein